MTDGLYAYALTREAVAARLETTGIGGAPVQVVAHDGLAALVSVVDLDEFGEAGLRAHLEDLDWVRDVAVAHDDVVREAAQLGPVAPLRLATVFHGEASVDDRLRHLGPQVQDVLDSVEGRSEWSVKVYSEPDAAKASTSRAGSGTEYLARRRREADERESASEGHVAAADELHGSLAEVAVAGRSLPAQDRQLTGHRGEMILNVAYLVEDRDAERFRGLVEDVRLPAGARATVDGPWPPYSFAVLEET